MTTKYKQFLNNIHVLSEDLFNEVIDSLPEVDIDSIDFDDGEFDSQDGVATRIIYHILENWYYVWADDVDFKNKTFYLADVQSLEDLEEINNKFSNWTIYNYNDLIEEIKENDEENEKDELDREFKVLIDKVRTHSSIEQLRKFVDSL